MSQRRRPYRGRYHEDFVWSCKNGHMHARKDGEIKCPECKSDLDVEPTVEQKEEAKKRRLEAEAAMTANVKPRKPNSWDVPEQPMEDYREFGLRRCPNGHYFHFTLGVCDTCREQSEEEQRQREWNFSPPAVRAIPTREELLEMAGFGLRKCVNGHTFHASWGYCYACGKTERRSPSPPPPQGTVESKRKNFNPFKAPREYELQQFKSTADGYRVGHSEPTWYEGRGPELSNKPNPELIPEEMQAEHIRLRKLFVRATRADEESHLGGADSRQGSRNRRLQSQSQPQPQPNQSSDPELSDPDSNPKSDENADTRGQ